MAAGYDIGVSTSQAIAQNPLSTLFAGTTINFGAGTINTPTENTVTPTNDATAVATTKSPGASTTAGNGVGTGGTGGTGTGADVLLYAPWLVAGLALVALGAVAFKASSK